MSNNSSSQKFIARNRAPRVQIEYDVEVYGSEKKIELPFVMGVLADLSGKPTDPLPPVTERKFLDIDIDNFDERMKAIGPRVAFSVADGLTLLVSTLESYPQHVHPQPDLDGAPDSELRANALAALADPEGLVDDVREVWVDDGLTSRLALRDIERAWAVPRVPDALPVDQVAAQLRQLREQGQPAVLALVAAAQQLDRLNLWIGQHLQGQVCELDTLARLLKPFQGEFWAGHEAVGATAVGDPAVSGSTAAEPVAGGQAPAQAMQAAAARVLAPVALADPADPAGSNAVASRQAAQAHIARAREWFEAHEPSSPVGVLLRQAERLVGKRYAEVAAAIPAELLARWDEADG